MNFPRIVNLPYGILISTDGNHNATLLGSELLAEFSDPDDDAGGKIAAVASNEAVESLLLALVAAGIDLESEPAQEAIRTSVEAIAHHIFY
jgi:hypothetical protein